MVHRVKITEVGPRDGLQNERAPVPSAAKIAFVEALVGAGLRQVEVTSFVHPGKVPAMADAEAVYSGIHREPGVRYLALVPNRRGYDRALAAGCDAIAVFTAASEGFTRANIGMTIAESLARFEELARLSSADAVAVRGYVSTVFACPYDGPVEPEEVLRVSQALLDLGCYEISLGDTIGVGTPSDVRRLLDTLVPRLGTERLALHFHDTWGMGAANAVAGLEYGIRSFDASAGGLGGCPYAPGASGNTATEDLVYLFHHLGYETGVDLAAVAQAAAGVAQHLDHPLPSRVHAAVMAGRREGEPDQEPS